MRVYLKLFHLFQKLHKCYSQWVFSPTEANKFWELYFHYRIPASQRKLVFESFKKKGASEELIEMMDEEMVDERKPAASPSKNRG